jgi:hypothetical protein
MFMQHHHRAGLCIAAALGLLAGANGIAQAQTVMGSGTPAGCVQNAGNGELACGSGSTAAPGTGATAIGINAKATADAAMAFGFNSIANSIAAMAFGKDANATNQGSVAIGDGASSTGNASTAVGFAARGLANDTVAVGDLATANGNFSTALGANTSAQFASSTALGYGAQATVANQMMFGTGSDIYALPGVNSAASKAALKGPLKMLVVDANGNVGVAAIPTCRCAAPPVRVNAKTRR